MLKISKRLGHSLIVPYVHQPVTKFTADLVPEDQVRALNKNEGKWEFWTSSQAFYITTPKTRGIVNVPLGEAWVVERFGKYSRTITEGISYVLPFIENVKTVKATTLTSLGFISTEINTKSGVYDAYGIAYYNITDPAKSAYYKDPESNKDDSERSASRILRRALAGLVEKRTDMKLSAAQKEELGAELLKTVKPRGAELGLEFVKVEVRGIFPKSQNVPVKLRAYEYPAVDLTTPGHDLSPDYWNDVLTPPQFQKMKFGSSYVPVTPITPSMEWNVPSPPDFHHFNMQPRVAVGPEEEELKKLGSAAH